MQAVRRITLCLIVAASLLAASLPLGDTARGAPPIVVTLVTGGLTQPVDIAHAGDNRLFIVEKAGYIRIWDGDELLATPFLDISTLTSTTNEDGLLGLAFHPDYGNNGRFFIDYVNVDGDIVVAEYSVSADPNIAAPSGVPLLTIPHPVHTNHNGGQIAFGPDGYLYIAVGDGGSGGAEAQNLDSLLGTILRIDVDDSAPYTSPPDNPFFGATPERDEIWAYGLRNPWRFSFDRLTGDLFVSDVGQAAREEVNFQASSSTGGENYGWPIMEGSLCYNPPTGCDTSGLVLPIIEYAHGAGDCAITGGYRYRGATAALQGMYVYGDFCSGRIWGATESGGVWSSELLSDQAFLISTFGEDAAGELYVAGYSTGSIYRIVGPPLGILGNLAAGGNQSCGIMDGAAWCWGLGLDGQLGDGINEWGHERVVPTPVQVLDSVSAITAGGHHTCAIQNGAAWCWGYNLHGQLGTGDFLHRNTPAPVQGLETGVTAISAGAWHTCAVKDGTAWCWGRGGHGQLGDGISEELHEAPVPVPVQGLGSGVTSISAGGFFTCALVDGGARCWGSGFFGQLGNGLSENSSVPVLVEGLTTGVSAITAGGFHACAISEGGAASCWGRGDDGRLGSGNTAHSSVPVAVVGLHEGVTAIAAGSWHTCALVNASVLCWGSNHRGQLGDGGEDGSTVPTEVVVAHPMASINTTAFHTCASDPGGGSWCWGEGTNGRLGNGMTDNSNTPVRVLGTDPSNPDTDADGLTDADEVFVYLTDPLNPDTSGDGYQDGEKVTLGTDPLHYCSIMRADVSHSGAVTIVDLSLVAQGFGQAIPPANPRHDQNADWMITIVDLSLMASVFGQKVTTCP
jgi:glucose/arabinose dehydrogenase/alpha-tubulin suppressor-like RCC1 family protein